MDRPARSWLPWWRELKTGNDVRETVIGELVVASGSLVACDPLCFLDGAKPFARSVKPGKYAVVIGELDGEIAYARLELGAAKPESWAPALCDGEVAPRRLRDTPGYPVDAGTACFVDATTRDWLVEKSGREVRANIQARLKKAGFDDKRHATVKASDGNLIAFRSGPGDGVYASFWGLDADGTLACLLTDFGLLDAEDDDVDSDEGDLDEDSAPTERESHERDSLRAPPAAKDENDASVYDTGERRVPQAPPLILLARGLIAKLEADELLELTDEEDARTSLVDDLADFLGSLVGERDAGERIAQWLVDHESVADVFGDDLTLVGAVRRALMGDTKKK